MTYVGVICCEKDLSGAKFNTLFVKYTELFSGRDVFPLLIPAMVGLTEAKIAHFLKSVVSGVVLPGAPSNVDPGRYGGEKVEGDSADLKRDGVAINVVNVARKLNAPVLGICRGMQEINVAYGGTLEQNLELTFGKLHSADSSVHFSKRYFPAHGIQVQEGGKFSKIIEKNKLNKSDLCVNSLHRQGVSRLGDGLRTEAVSDDGVIEAISCRESDFIFGVQWHPEWHGDTQKINGAVVSEFFEHVDRYAQKQQEDRHV